MPEYSSSGALSLTYP